MITKMSDIAALRAKWLELEYDSVMSNDAGRFVWNTLKEQVRLMNRDDLLVALEDMEAFDAENQDT